MAKLTEHGYHSRTIPKEYGGYGATPDILKSRIIEEFSNAQVNTGFSGQGINATPVLLKWVPKSKANLYQARYRQT